MSSHPLLSLNPGFQTKTRDSNAAMRIAAQVLVTQQLVCIALKVNTAAYDRNEKRMTRKGSFDMSVASWTLGVDC